MKQHERISKDPRVASISRNGRDWVVVMKGGWFPSILAGTSVRALASKLSTVRPIPSPTGSLVELEGYRCTIPPMPTSQLPRRRHHVEVVGQLPTLPILRVRLDAGHASRFRWIHLRDTRDWCEA